MVDKAKLTDYESWKKQQAEIASLLLDVDNIRLDIDRKSTLSQGALISDLFSNEDAMGVLKSIADNGYFPDERLVVIKEKDGLVVIEGNRRTAALKVLFRPEILPNKEAQVKEILKTAQPIPRSLEVVVAPDRSAVQRFLASKHTQRAKKPWRPMRQAYFYKAQLDAGKSVQDLINEYPGAKVVDFLRLINIHRIAKSIKYDSDDIAKKVHSESRFPTSTIQRLFESKPARDFLGFDFSEDGEVVIKIKESEFIKGFKKFIEDAATGHIDTRKLNKAEGIQKYLDEFSAAEKPSKAKGSKDLTSEDFEEVPSPTGRKKRRLAPTNIEFNLKAPAVERMLQELQDIDYEKFPNATHDLLRSFLECSIKKYFEQKGSRITPTGRNPYVYLNNVLNAFKAEMDTEKNHELSQLTQTIINDTKMTVYSAPFLNALNHNPSIFTTGKEVKEAWDKMEPLIRHVLKCKQ